MLFIHQPHLHPLFLGSMVAKWKSVGLVIRCPGFVLYMCWFVASSKTHLLLIVLVITEDALALSQHDSRDAKAFSFPNMTQGMLRHFLFPT